MRLCTSRVIAVTVILSSNHAWRSSFLIHYPEILGIVSPRARVFIYCSFFMMSHRRFLLQDPPLNQSATVGGEEAHHLIQVLRASTGGTVELIDGSGRVWEGRISEIHQNSVEISQVHLIDQEPALGAQIIMVQSMCKADKLELILQKGTEMGVSQIFLLDAVRSVVKIPAERLENRLQRWGKILMGAAKQSRRSTLPILHPPRSCQSVCLSLQADLKILFSESEKTRSLKMVLRGSKVNSVAFAIGPEGGWTSDEEAVFFRHQFRPSTLGSGILRTETAALAALAILKYEMEY